MRSWIDRFRTEIIEEPRKCDIEPTGYVSHVGSCLIGYFLIKSHSDTKIQVIHIMLQFYALPSQPLPCDLLTCTDPTLF